MPGRGRGTAVCEIVALNSCVAILIHQQHGVASGVCVCVCVCMCVAPNLHSLLHNHNIIMVTCSL